MLLAFRECMKSPTFRKEIARCIASYADLFAVEPHYTKQVAMRLIPMSEDQITAWSTRLQIPQRYRVFGRNHIRHRMYSASEIVQLRNAVTRGKEFYAEKILTKEIKTRTRSRS
jgi:hypothetical protein